MPIIDSESILIVDDERLVADTLREALVRQGHHCLIAGTGAEALRCLRSTNVALVLLDLRLPDMTGIEVMHAALRQGNDPDILIMTGQASAESAMEAVEGSTVGYILKPIEMSRLVGIVRRILERRRFGHYHVQRLCCASRLLRDIPPAFEASLQEVADRRIIVNQEQV